MTLGPRAMTSPMPKASGSLMRTSTPGRGRPTLVAFEDVEAEGVHVALDLLVQGGAAGDEVANLPAEARVDGAEDDGAEVEGRFVAEAAVELDERFGGVADPLAALAQARHDAPVEKLPQGA